MGFSKFKFHGAGVLVTLTALTVGAGTMRATNNTLLAASPTITGSVTCSTLTGLGNNPATVSVKTAAALTTTAVVTVTPVAVAGLVITPASLTLNSTNSQATTNTFTVSAAPGCANLVSGSAVANVIHFTTAETGITTPVASNTDTVSASVNSTLTVSNQYAVSAAAITVYCSKIGSTYVPSATAAVLSVTSTANGGTPFTISGLPAWVTATSLTGGTATSTAVTTNFTALAPCNNLAAAPGTTSSGTITLNLSAGAAAQTTTVNVSIVMTAATPLTATPSSFSMSHTKGSGIAQTQAISVTSSPSGSYFTVATATLPIWLTVNATYAIAPASLTFSTTNVADTLPPGTYNATVNLQVFGGAGDLPVSVSLFVTNSAPKLSITSANPAAVTWVQGTAAPTTTIIATSTDAPIPYTITSGGNLAPIVSASQSAGLAYSFGTNIGVTFPAQIYQTAQPGTVITGTVSLTWGSPATTTIVTINLTVASPGASLSAIAPATVPTAAPPMTYSIVLSGNGFVGGSNTALNTKVGIVVGGVMVADSNLSVPNVLNSSSMVETITVPTSTDALLPFAPTVTSGTPGGNVTLGVCNGNCYGQAPTGTIVLSIGGGPVVQGVTSSSSFQEVTLPALASIAPYDMISIFGENFCSSLGTGCSSSTLLGGAPAGVTQTYPFFLSPDAPPVGNATDTRRKVTVTFYPHGTTSNGVPAPLLFVTNSQINAMVPGSLSTGTEYYDVVVGFSSNTATLTSNAFEVNVVAADPGIFTIGSDGQGGAAALENSNYSLITSSNPAGMRSGGTDSDILQIYATGLGAPSLTTTGANCFGITPYIAALVALPGVSNTLNNIDGDIIQTSLLPNGDLPPCLATAPTVKLGGVSITPTYAGFVASSIAGLYQIDILLPSSVGTFYPNYPSLSSPITNITAPVQLPLTVTVGSVTSQTGVSLWVAPRLNVEPPTVLSGPVTVSWAGSCGTWSSNGSSTGTCVVANPAEATGSIHYAITSGVLPAGLSFNQSTGNISGTPTAQAGGTYAITVTATDSAATPVTGSVTFTLNISSDLVVTPSVSGNFTSTFGASGSTLTTLSTAGGLAPYSYTLTSPSMAVTGLSLSGAGALAITSALEAGTYPLTVHVADSTASPLTATANYNATLTVALNVANTVPAAQTHGTAGVISTISSTGQSGTVAYALDNASITNGFTLVPAANNTVLLEPTTVSGSGTFTVTITATDNAMATGSNADATGTVTLTNFTVN
jgi:uncharacterized protein (TIGR03437 family)